jgi:hypothetical protein
LLNDIEDGLLSDDVELGVHLTLSLLLHVRETFEPLGYPPRAYLDRRLRFHGGDVQRKGREICPEEIVQDALRFVLSIGFAKPRWEESSCRSVEQASSSISQKMRRYVQKTISRSIPTTRLSIAVSPRFLHSSPFLLKRHSDSKVRHQEERQAKKKDLEEKLESAEKWMETHAPSITEPIMGRRAMLLEETDPFETDELKQKVKNTLDYLRKEGSVIKQGRTNPELIRRLQVELPANLGGKMAFSDVANIGPKPGNARSLQITVFDIAVRAVQYN